MSSQYGEFQPTNCWDALASLGHPSKFQWVLHLGSVTACHYSSGHQPDFASLNIFGRAAVTLGIGPHSSFRDFQRFSCGSETSALCQHSNVAAEQNIICHLTARDVTEPAKIHFHQVHILYVRSVGFGCGFVTQSQLIQLRITILVCLIKPWNTEFYLKNFKSMY